MPAAYGRYGDLIKNPLFSCIRVRILLPFDACTCVIRLTDLMPAQT
jgi:hypothetical protein